MQTNTIRISDLKMQPDRLEHIAQELHDITLLANDGHTSWKASSFLFELKEEHSVYLGCFEDEKLIGYICCMTVLDEASVNNFAVLPEYQGEGVGTALLRAMILLLAREKPWRNYGWKSAFPTAEPMDCTKRWGLKISTEEKIIIRLRSKMPTYWNWHFLRSKKVEVKEP